VEPKGGKSTRSTAYNIHLQESRNRKGGGIGWDSEGRHGLKEVRPKPEEEKRPKTLIERDEEVQQTRSLGVVSSEV